MLKNIKRGDIFMANLGKDNVVGSEQKGFKPVIVVQNNRGNKKSGTVIVACITKQDKGNMPIHVPIKLYKPSTVLLEQIKTIDKQRLKKWVGVADKETMRKVNQSLRISLGL